MFGGGWLTIHNWEGLVAAAGFNAAYLHAHENVRIRGGFAFRARLGGTKSPDVQAATDTPRSPLGM
jgi:hypothetical protein